MYYAYYYVYYIMRLAPALYATSVVMFLYFAGSGKPREAYFSSLELCSFLRFSLIYRWAHARAHTIIP